MTNRSYARLSARCHDVVLPALASFATEPSALVGTASTRVVPGTLLTLRSFVGESGRFSHNRIERSGPAAQTALLKSSPDEAAQFATEYRTAIHASDTLDLSESPANQVVGHRHYPRQPR